MDEQTYWDEMLHVNRANIMANVENIATCRASARSTVMAYEQILASNARIEGLLREMLKAMKGE